MTDADILRIEVELGVRLPQGYKDTVLAYPFEEDRQTLNWSLGDLAAAVIDQTQKYRGGFSVNRPWPQNLVWIGTEGDACPLVLDVNTGGVLKLYKGNPEGPPMESYSTFEEFLLVLNEDWSKMSEDERGLRNL